MKQLIFSDMTVRLVKQLTYKFNVMGGDMVQQIKTPVKEMRKIRIFFVLNTIFQEVNAFPVIVANVRGFQSWTCSSFLLFLDDMSNHCFKNVRVKKLTAFFVQKMFLEICKKICKLVS